MIAGCYTLDLYCDKDDDKNNLHEFREFPHQYIHEFGSACRRKARQDGWKLNTKQGVAICPKCSGKKRR